MSTHDHSDRVVGLDAGIESLVTWDDGKGFGHIENRRVRTRYEKELRRHQRALARCKRGSKRRVKVRVALSRVSLRVANARSTHLHQVTEKIAREYGVICVEKLKIKNMSRSAAGTAAEPGRNVRQKSGLNRSIQDAGWGILRQLLSYKAERAGGVLIDVDAKWTSQTCSGCGVVVKKALSEREHRCSDCGLVLHRDVNAARNIRAKGLAALAADTGVVARGEPNVADCGVRAPETLLVA